MITYHKRVINETKLELIDSFTSGCWINVVNPNNDELKFLTEKLNIDFDLLEEGLDQNELPRFDDYENQKYIFIKTPSKTNSSLNTLLIVIGSNFFLTLSKENSQALDDILSGKKIIYTTQRLKFLISILSINNDYVEKKVLSIVKNVQTKKSSTNRLKDSDLEVLLNYEDFLNNLVSMYSYTSNLYSKIMKNIKFFEEDQDLLEDLIVETEEGINTCKNSLKTITNITNYYSIILTNRLNNTIKLLTLITIFINIPAAIGSIFGMNVLLPFENSKFAFFYVLVLISIITTIFIIYMRKKNLI